MATGKLRRRTVGQTPSNPPYQMPMKTLGGVTAQKRLLATTALRSDPYSLQDPDSQDHEPRKRRAEASVAQFSPLKRRRQDQQSSRATKEQEEAFADPYEEEVRSSAEQLRQEAIEKAQGITDAQPQRPRRSLRSKRSELVEGSQTSPTTSRQPPAATSPQSDRMTTLRIKNTHVDRGKSIETIRASTRGRGRPKKSDPAFDRLMISAGRLQQTSEHQNQRKSSRLQDRDVILKPNGADQTSKKSTTQASSQEPLPKPVSGKLKAPQMSTPVRSRPSRAQDVAAASSLASAPHTLGEVELGGSRSGTQHHVNNAHSAHEGQAQGTGAESPLFLPADDSEQLPSSSPSQDQRTAGNHKKITGPKERQPWRSASETDDVADDEPADDFYGQWHHLKLAIRGLSVVGINIVDGVPHPIKMRDKRTKKLRRVCRRAIEKFKSLSESADPDQDPIEELEQLREIVDNFKQDIPGRVLRSTSVDLHRIAIPQMVRLSQNMIECYRAMDKNHPNSWRGPLTIGHLRQTTTLLEMIVGLGKHANACPRPPTQFAIRKSVMRVLAHVDDAFRGLRKVVNSHESSQAEVLDRARWQALQTQQEERREAHQRQRHEAFKVRRKWAALHEERIAAEGGILCLTRAKMRHLLLPVSSYVTSIDSHGDSFSREELITTRAGPLPEHVEAARAQKWSLIELGALATGLQKHQGEFVFEKIFREHCRREVGLLVDYSVTEIVTTASDLRHKLLREQGQPGAVVGEWIERVPVWVRPRGPGAENVVDP